MTATFLEDEQRAWEDFTVRMSHLNALEILAWSDVPYSRIDTGRTYNSRLLPQLTQPERMSK